ncbi:efflux RND transporter permease subunit [Paraglaciecola sp.]|uniref:efflux RND transporter permease subunit n=1 Tax=Paraglaciecola sp. TaxID=1920173 RepID=UPI00273D3460|nr:efflux RND transporter permease subunit [Paraglaciecola sp.]MDP5032303.1 efflux RND transporter permease subunit [Paraglaciecola sp.]|tara:strand:- start:2171 stop:5224 length:3054 start_codon:yes stop_codon:yes gene_type:complete
MDFARYFIKNRTTSWMVTLILLIGGIMAFLEIGRLEDPQFTIKQAMIITSYPGASPTQVEEEVTYPLENAIQELPYVKNIRSFSSAGLSQILVEMKSTYRKDDLRKIWTELRQKISDKRSSIAQGAYEPIVKDDFADVYGMMLAISGKGYQYDDVRDYVNYLKRDLVLVDGVGKVMLQGEQKEQVVVEISRTKIANLGISPDHLSALLSTQNQVSNAGKVKIGSEYIRFNPTGEFQSVDELKDLIISSTGSSKLIHLGDVATIYRDYAEIPTNLIRFNGQEAMLLGISFADGVNVVEVGHRIEARIQELDYMRPVGMETNFVYNQPQEVDKSVQSFLLNLVEAIVIVVIVLLLFMGLRSGLLIGLILMITVLGTFIFMQQMDITLQRISLGALIIALGMLVDNAIVVTEGILIGLQRKLTVAQGASAIVKQNKWPLLGATVIAIIAFAPIGLSSDATGEFAGSLFWVLLISLLLSWVTAITLTPFFASLMFTEKGEDEEEEELYQSIIFKAFGRLLTLALAWRKTTVVALVALFIGSIVSFGQVKQSFFPPSTTPMFFVDVWHKSGTDIRENAKVMEEIEAHLLKEPGVEEITTTVGQGLLRFLLTYQTEKQYSTYAQMAIRMTDLEALQAGLPKLRDYMQSEHGDVFFKIKLMEIGPSTDAKIEARFSGPDPVILRELSEQSKAILRADKGALNIRDDWRQKTSVIRPQFNEASARRVGVSKADLDDLLLTSFSGKTIGVYRDGVNLLPIVTRPPATEHLSVENLQSLQIYSSVAGQFIPVTQVVSGFDVEWEDPIVARRDRKRTITVMADHDILGSETAANLFARIQAPIEAIPLPKGYSLEWGGEHESSTDAQKALFGSLPLGYLIMFIITVLLFNSARIAGVIWACVPLALIGVSYGLLFSGYAFSFMALLGMLSLSGMIIKNGIVLVEQIKFELEQGKDAYNALFLATLSRVRPVCMAAITTILGMIPLLFDDFFGSMAVAIMCGLGFSTFITLVFVPVLYSLVFKITPAKS